MRRCDGILTVSIRRPQAPTPVRGWVQSLPLAELLLDALPKQLDDDDDDQHSHPLRAVSQLDEHQLQVTAICFAQGLQRLLREGVEALGEAFRAFDETLKNSEELQTKKAAAKFEQLQDIKCGTIEDFHAGLEGRIGADPAPAFGHLRIVFRSAI
jgi:hypothetical protein